MILITRIFVLLLLIELTVAFIDFSSITNFISNLVGDSNSNSNREERQCKDEGIMHKPPCDENRLMLNLAELCIISPERIVLMLASQSITEQCSKVSSTINKVEKEFQSCIPMSPCTLYIKLYEALKVFHTNVCLDEKIVKKVTKLSECLKELHEEFLDCEGPADWYEKTNKTRVCQIFVEILNCDYIKTAELCGLDTAHFIHTISIDIFKPILPDTCSIPRTLPKVKEPMPSMPDASERVDEKKPASSVTRLKLSFLLLVMMQIYCYILQQSF